jgi:hypothetical protein
VQVKSPGERLTILVSGMIAADPYQGGATWAVLQYLLGFRRLGHRVLLIEPVHASSLQPSGAPLSESINARYFRQVMKSFGLEEVSALLDVETGQTMGAPYDRLREWTRHTDLHLNISGMLTDPALVEPIPLRVYLDLDPAFVQLWHATQGIDMRFAGHHRFVTVGLNIGTSRCDVPTCGLDWIPTLQPIVLDCWPVADRIVHDAFTTVGNWRGYGSIDHDGVFYGQKAHSVRRFIDLPQRARESFVLAMNIHPGDERDREALIQNGWRLVDPVTVAGRPERYRRFIQGSRGEIGFAKSGYIVSNCGWFSDRSIAYLASGKPVIAQETGFSEHLSAGTGLLAFQTSEDLLNALEQVRGDYKRHSRAARALAESHFNSDTVLTGLLEKIGSSSVATPSFVPC